MATVGVQAEGVAEAAAAGLRGRLERLEGRARGLELQLQAERARARQADQAARHRDRCNQVTVLVCCTERSQPNRLDCRSWRCSLRRRGAATSGWRRCRTLLF